MEMLSFSQITSSFTLSLPRMIAVFTILPFLSKTMLGGTLLRNAVAFSLALILLPVVIHEKRFANIEPFFWLVLILKETFLGIIIGFLATIPFWAIEAVGFVVDNQRGASMASSMNPLSGSQASPLGILLIQMSVTMFFVGGSFILFLGMVYTSYSVWPIFSILPKPEISTALFFVDQLDFLLRFTAVFAAPILIAMFLAEFGLALVSRFAPQLNVFFLAMPVKSAVALVILIVYLVTFANHIREHLDYSDSLLSMLKMLIGTRQP